jgi:aspartyl aminopeptidase
VDNAHGIHPNFPHKHDEGHGPKLNAGPVIKYDANQGYATSSETAAQLKLLADAAGVPVQTYVTRADMRCGSTIGPMTSAKTGIRTVDLGVPTFGMHSIRETAGAQDLEYLNAILKRYLEVRVLSL